MTKQKIAIHDTIRYDTEMPCLSLS